MLMSYSKNQQAAKDLLRWVILPQTTRSGSSRRRASPRRRRCSGKATSCGRGSGDGPLQGRSKLGQAPGFAGPAGKKAAETLTKYVIVDMYAKAIQGASAEDSVKWAEGD